MRLQLLPHPPYSPDFAPSDYDIFSHVKKRLRGHKFRDTNEAKHTIRMVLENFPAEFFKKGLKALKKRSEKCVALDENYVEKLSEICS